jgi:hypothetical protein
MRSEKEADSYFAARGGPALVSFPLSRQTAIDQANLKK